MNSGNPSRHRTVSLLVILVLLVIRPPTSCSDIYTYVSLAGEQKVVVYRLSDGKLGAPIQQLEVTDSPGSSVFEPRRKIFYLAVRGEGRLLSFLVKSDGTLAPQSSVTVYQDPAYVQVDPRGRFLLSAYYATGKVAIHPLSEEGEILADVRWYDTAEKAHAVAIDPSNQFVLVPHTGPNSIFQFRWNSTLGKLTACTPDRIRTGLNTGPRHVVFHPKLPVVYADNEQGSSVTAFHWNAQTGQLSAKQTVSTLPVGFNENNSCARLAMTNDGRFLYASNRGHNSIAGFRIGIDGLLKPLGQIATEEVPRGFAIAPSDDYLIAAGQKSGKLQVYTIDENGRLNPTQKVVTGKQPWWVTCIVLRQHDGD
jgi:6-phosphogluconolactonase